MSTIQQLVDQLSTGGSQWKIVGGGTPVEETAPVAVPANAADLTPATTVNRGTGRYYVTVQDAEGHQRAMFLKPEPITNTISGQPSDIVVRQSGVNDADPTKVYSGDLSKLSWSSGGPVGDVPQGTKEPSPTSALVAIDAKGNEVPRGDPNAKQLRDNKTGTTFNLVTDPAGTLHDLGNDVILVKPDGSYTKVATKPEEKKQLNVAGVGLVDYDPAKPEGSKYSVAMAVPTNPNDLGGLQTRGDKTYAPTRAADGTISFVETNLPADVQIGYTLNDANSRTIQFFDKQGKPVGTADKGPDWKAPVQVQPGTAPAADQIAAKIPTFNPQTGALEFTDNPNQLKASDATAELAKQLGVKIAAGSMSEKQAQDIITGAVNTMNAQTQRMTAETQQQAQVRGAAGDILTAASQGATTGAGLLNQRISSATGALNSIVSSAAGSKMTSVPAGVGQGLVGGLQDWITGLGGGQGVYDTAARLVQASDPKISGDPTLAQQAQQTLAGMLTQYQRETGQPHPTVAATQAAQQSQQSGGMAAPATVMPTPTPVPTPITQPAPVAAGFQAPPAQVPGQNYGNNLAYTGGVAPSQYGYTPPGGSSYSYGGPVPWAGAAPQPLPPGTVIPFTAPQTLPPPLTAQAVLAGRA